VAGSAASLQRVQMPLIAVWQSNPTGSHVLWTHQLKLATLTGFELRLFNSEELDINVGK